MIESKRIQSDRQKLEESKARHWLTFLKKCDDRNLLTDDLLTSCEKLKWACIFSLLKSV